MVCLHMSFWFLQLLDWPTVLRAVAIIAFPSLFVVWLVRAVLGRRAGRIGGYMMMVLLTAIPILLAVQCEVEMAVPMRFEGDRAVSNKGTVRFLTLMGAAIIPAVLMGLTAVWLSIWLFFRQPKDWVRPD